MFVTASSEQLWSCNNFVSEMFPLEGCEWSAARLKWGDENVKGVNDPAGGSQRVLQIHYPAGSLVNTEVPGGTSFNAWPFPAVDEALFQFDIMFSENFDFVKGGKLPGLYGGEKGLCSGGNNGPGCFSTRFLFKEEGKSGVTAYLPPENGDWFCAHEQVTCNFKYGHTIAHGSFQFKKGKWQTIAQYIKLNDPGVNNGIFRIFYDGENVFELTGLIYRFDESVQINMLLFATFFGGNDPAWASTADVDTYMKNFHVTVP